MWKKNTTPKSIKNHSKQSNKKRNNKRKSRTETTDPHFDPLTFRQTNSVVRATDIFGQRRVLWMPFVNATNLSSGVTQNLSGATLIFQLGALSKPFTTQANGTLLPLGFTEIATIFRRYRVLGVHIMVEFYDPTVDGGMCLVAVVPSQDTASYAGIAVQELAVRRGVFTEAISNTGSREVRFDQYIPIQQVEGISDAQWQGAFTQYEGTLSRSVAVASQPAKIVTLQLNVTNTLNTTNLVVNAKVSLSFHVEIYDRINLNTSSSLA